MTTDCSFSFGWNWPLKNCVGDRNTLDLGLRSPQLVSLGLLQGQLALADSHHTLRSVLYQHHEQLIVRRLHSKTLWRFFTVIVCCNLGYYNLLKISLVVNFCDFLVRQICFVKLFNRYLTFTTEFFVMFYSYWSHILRFAYLYYRQDQ